jgi:hypothetical protein
MSVTVRKYQGGDAWEVDVLVLLPDGTRHRERRKVPAPSKAAAKRWGESRQRELMLKGPPERKKEVETLREFAPRFLDGYARANRHKPSGIAGKATVFRAHLLPALGDTRLDAITNEDVQALKLRLKDRSPKTVNNVLTVLSVLLKKAVEWEVLDKLPCSVRAAADSEEYGGAVLRLRGIRAGRGSGEAGRRSGVSHRAARRGSGPSLRRDHGARMVRR